MLHDFLNQIESALENDNYLLSLYTALTIPDLCGALGSTNGRATAIRYIKWYNDWVNNYPKIFDGQQCYAYRNCVLHQGRSTHKNLGYDRIIFVVPGSSKMFKAHMSSFKSANVIFLCIDIEEFVIEMTNGTRNWIKNNQNNQNLLRNYKYFMQRNDKILDKFIKGFDGYIIT